MKTNRQVGILMTELNKGKTLRQAAAKADMCASTARRYRRSGKTPKAMRAPRRHRTLRRHVSAWKKRHAARQRKLADIPQAPRADESAQSDWTHANRLQVTVGGRLPAPAVPLFADALVQAMGSRHAVGVVRIVGRGPVDGAFGTGRRAAASSDRQHHVSIAERRQRRPESLSGIPCMALN